MSIFATLVKARLNKESINGSSLVAIRYTIDQISKLWTVVISLGSIWLISIIFCTKLGCRPKKMKMEEVKKWRNLKQRMLKKLKMYVWLTDWLTDWPTDRPTVSCKVTLTLNYSTNKPLKFQSRNIFSLRSHSNTRSLILYLY